MRSLFSSFLLIFLLASCAAPTESATPTVEATVTSQATVTSTSTPASTPTPEAPENFALQTETQYRQTLTAEQQVLYDQASDRTSEGLHRKFLEGDLSGYLVYVDIKDNEVTSVWNYEQNKVNPALLIENNLLINEAGKNEIIWNPELNRQQAQKTLANYFRYARARVCAAGQGVQLPKTLDGALADPKAQEYLANGCRVTLGRASALIQRIDHKYDVPNQNIFVSGSTGVVIKFVDHETDNMIFSENAYDSSIYHGWSFDQTEKGPLEINYFNQGAENIATYKEFKDMILARRIMLMFQSLFYRAEFRSGNGIGAKDSVTFSVIFNHETLDTTPIVIYSRTR